jgi:hypothetical protein
MMVLEATKNNGAGSYQIYWCWRLPNLMVLAATKSNGAGSWQLRNLMVLAATKYNGAGSYQIEWAAIGACLENKASASRIGGAMWRLPFARMKPCVHKQPKVALV